MANENNIVDYSFNKLSTEKQRKIASMGGKKSGEVRREKATMKKVLMDMLEEISGYSNLSKAISFKLSSSLVNSLVCCNFLIASICSTDAFKVLFKFAV